MTKHKNLKEHIKTLLIVLLTLSALFLLKESSYYDSIFSRIGGSGSQQSTLAPGTSSGIESKSGAILPFSIVVSSAEGGRYSTAYNSEETQTVFESFSAALGEALGSAGAPEQTDEKQWQAALSGSCVSFDFYYAQSLSVLASRLGTGVGGGDGYSARHIALDCSGTELQLLFKDSESGGYFRCTTAVTAQNTAAKLESYKQNNAIFAFENEKYAGIEPNTVIPDSMPVFYTAASVSAFDSGFDSELLFELLGMNSYVARAYTESDGTQVYVEDGSTIRISPAGKISYRLGSGSRSSFGTDMPSAANAADSLIHQLLDSSCGDAQVCFSGIEGSNGSYVAEFQYKLSSLPVEASSPAAKVTISGGRIVRMELSPKNYELSQESSVLLPILQTSAIIASQGGGEPVLLYRESGGTLECMWVSK